MYHLDNNLRKFVLVYKIIFTLKLLLEFAQQYQVAGSRRPEQEIPILQGVRVVHTQIISICHSLSDYEVNQKIYYFLRLYVFMECTSMRVSIHVSERNIPKILFEESSD